jgi:hypothetical protein
MSIPVTPCSYAEEVDVAERLRRMAAEMRATELVFTLACAVAGAPNWRQEAKQLLGEIAEGIVPEPSDG